jgi:hypothetical protein
VGPPAPKARIIFLKTTGSFLLEERGGRERKATITTLAEQLL